MSGINTIKKIISKYGRDKTISILSQDVLVTEKFNAFRFSFEKQQGTNNILFYGKNGKSYLNKIDRTISNLYEDAIDYIESLPKEILESIPSSHRFGFSWFPSKNPLEILYEKQPKNGLILTDITIRNQKSEIINQVNEQSVFNRWADILKVDYAKPIFKGRLSNETVTKLLENSDFNNLEFLKESEIYTLGFLNKKKPNIEALILEFPDQLIKLGKESEASNESRSHLFDILLMNICEHIENYNLSSININENIQESDEKYISIVSEIFNDYVKNKGQEFLESGISKPSFLNKSGEVTTKWIKNKKTLSILESNKNYEYLLTVFLTNLKKPKYKSGLISESVANSFNRKIEEIEKLSGNKEMNFLEFSSISRDDLILENEEIELEKKDYVKVISLVTRFFDVEAKNQKGKEKINIVVTNIGLTTLDLIEECLRLNKLNGFRCILVHSRRLRKNSFGAEEESIEKILNSINEKYTNLFAGYLIVDRIFFRKVLNIFRPDFEPAIISTEEGLNDMKLEQESMSILYSKEILNNITIEKYRTPSKDSLIKSLEENDYNEFKKLVPVEMQPYWTEMVATFKKFYYV